MNIPASDLKTTLKKLSPVRTETYQVSDGLSAQDSDIYVFAGGPLADPNPYSINGKKLTQVVNRMSGQIEISRQDRVLTLKSARAKVELEIQPIKPPKVPESPKMLIPFDLSLFKTAMAKATNWASTNKSAQFGGVVQVRTVPSTKIEDNTSPGYAVVGTDGNSLSVVEVGYPLLDEYSWLINLEAAAVVQLMDSAPFGIGATDNHLKIQSGSTVVYASRPNKNFPDYPKFVPTQFDFTIQVKSADFVSALRTIEPLIEEETDGGGISIQIRDGVVQLSSLGTGNRSEDSVEYEQVYPDPVFDPKEFSLKMKASYLSSFFSKAGEISTVSFLGPNKPVKFQSGDITTIVMPIGKVEKK